MDTSEQIAQLQDETTYEIASSLLLGCGKKLEDRIVGEWKGEYGPEVRTLVDPTTLAMSESMLRLQLNKDGTYKLGFIMPSEGTWKLAGRRLYLKQDKAMGMTPKDFSAFLNAVSATASKQERGKNDRTFSSEDFTLHIDADVSEDGETIHLSGQVGTMSSKLEVPFKKQG